MLRLPRLEVVAPDAIDGVVAALAAPGARIVAGGTDLLPNLKHRLARPPLLVSLHRVRGLGEIAQKPGELSIGAGVTLASLAAHETVRAVFPSLAKAAGLAASPLIRNTATLGGNVNLDTRCRYVNQTELWRGALGGCLKSGGDVCHVVPSGRKCVAALSSDCVPVLLGLGARAVLVGPDGGRALDLADYYRGDGVRHTVRRDREVMTEIRVPLPAGPRRTAYAKWSVRRSIDFPLVSVALRFDLDADSVDANVTAASVVAGVLGARPRRVTRLDGVVGRRLSDPEVAAAVSERAHAQCKPVDNVPYESGYRCRMIRVRTRRAIEEIVRAG